MNTSRRKTIKVLITAAGSTNGVNVISALRQQKEIPLYLVGADMDPLAAGMYLADAHYVVPKASSPDYIPRLIAICKKEGIEIVLPTYSAELPFLAAMKERLALAGLRLALSSREVYEITEDKRKTSEYFKRWNIPSPRLYEKREVREGRVRFPVVIKPNGASGSKDVVFARSPEDLHFFIARIKDSVVQDVAEGKEYTIDGVSDLHGKMIVASPRLRLEVRGGLAVKSITVKNDAMVRFTKKIVEGFGMVGPFNVQCFKKGTKLQFIEVNNRFPSGGLPLTVAAGCNIPLIVVKLLLGRKIPPARIKTGIMMTRYWDSVVLTKKGNTFYRI